MILHVTLVLFQCMLVAAFLVLWYLWVKRKIESSCFSGDGDQVLFQFRYLSWILFGLVVLLSITQIQFARLSAGIDEKLASTSSATRIGDQSGNSVDQIKVMIEKLRKDLDDNFSDLRVRAVDTSTRTKPLQRVADLRLGMAGTGSESFLKPGDSKASGDKSGYAAEAKASSAASMGLKSHNAREVATEEPEVEHSLKLNRQGLVMADKLQIRKKPESAAPPVDRLSSGEQVKVTEKRILKNGEIWFRVVAPSGRAGWVDYRYIKLGGNV
jgi:hypothetical protein